MSSTSGKKRARSDDHAEESQSRRDEIARLKDGFLGSSKSVGREGNMTTSAQDFVQPKKRKGSKSKSSNEG